MAEEEPLDPLKNPTAKAEWESLLGKLKSKSLPPPPPKKEAQRVSDGDVTRKTLELRPLPKAEPQPQILPKQKMKNGKLKTFLIHLRERTLWHLWDFLRPRYLIWFVSFSLIAPAIHKITGEKWLPIPVAVIGASLITYIFWYFFIRERT